MHPALADDILQAAAPIFAAMLTAYLPDITTEDTALSELLDARMATLRQHAIEQAIALRNAVRAHPGMPDV